MTQPYILSIEPIEGETFQHKFHLGTDIGVAKKIAVEMFHARNQQNMPTRTVALLRDNKIVDCYDGKWSSEYDSFEAFFDLSE
jgi:hypothetical protein